MMTKKTQKYPCPKCKLHKLMKDGHTAAGAQRWTCKSRDGDDTRIHCYSTTDPTAPYRGQDGKAKRKPEKRKAFRRKINVQRTLVFTAAQNATPVHEGFHAALRSFVDDMDAELAVIPLRYKNPTSTFTGSQRNEETWAPELKDVMYEQRKKLNKRLVVIGDVKIQPTAADPLTGLEGLTHGESGIFGHTKLRMKCIATPQNQMPKVLTTTGAITVPNYTDSKAGKKGEFHHVLGAVVVEIESATKFHLHHINARKDGAFIFQRTAYYPDGSIEDAGPAKAIIFGDAHYRFADPKVVEATFGSGGLVDTLNPEVLIWHDLLDCYFGNPHHRGNPFIEIAKRRAQYHLARNEVEETIAWVCKLSAGQHKNYIVASNHDDMFARWIIREDWKEHPDNAEFYLETALQMVRSARMIDTGAEYLDPFGYWVERLTKPEDNIIALRKNQSLMIGDIECSFHGDKGPNGARGTIKNLSTIGVKVISGHGHAPAIQDGHTRVGTMTRLSAEYVDGPSAWLNTHASIDAFGKRHLHTCVDGKFWL